MEYDALSRVITSTAADGGVSSYRYDALDRLTGRMDALGNVTEYGYECDNIGLNQKTLI